MTLPTALTIALLVAEVAAVVLAVRARVGRPLVVLLAFALADEVAVLGLHAILAGAPRPIAGLYRVPYHLENAFSLGWPCLLAAACWRASEAAKGASKDRQALPSVNTARCFGIVVSPAVVDPTVPRHARGAWVVLRDALLSVRDRGAHVLLKVFAVAVVDVVGALFSPAPRRKKTSNHALDHGVNRAHDSTSGQGVPVVSLQAIDVLAGCYLGLLLALVAVYPLPRVRLRWLFLAWEVACVALAWAGLYGARLRPWGPVERCLVILAACETMVALVGPFASDPFTRWWIGRVFYFAAWCGIVGVLARGTTTRSS